MRGKERGGLLKPLTRSLTTNSVQESVSGYNLEAERR
jgi:hypothetical protein